MAEDNKTVADATVETHNVSLQAAKDSMEDVKSWREIPISQTNPATLQSYLRPLGMPGLPYPMAEATKDDKGNLVYNLGVVQSRTNALRLYTDMPHERVYGTMVRDMPIPSFLPAQKELIEKLQPTSNDRLWCAFGDPAFGKSYAFRSMAKVIHPQGAITVDCGGMNMREIFFRTVIDYGKGVKEQFEERAAQGKLLKSTIDDLNASFPGSVIEKEGRTVIDWNAIGARKTDAEGHAQEDRGAAIVRAKEVMTALFEREGLSAQSNAFGIKTIPGEFFEAYNTGRPLFLDEFTKCKSDTLDSWQTALQCINGEKGFESVDIYNPMADSTDTTSPKFITISRKDFKPSFIVGVAGNEAKDGRTTHTLSDSMLSRMHTIYVAEPTLMDFKHRISQIITGLPLTTLHYMFGAEADGKPAEFAEYLMDMRKLGLSSNERKIIPAHEIYMLKNWQDTKVAVDNLASYYFDRMKLGEMDPDFLKGLKNDNLEDELSSMGKKIKTTFRTIIDDMAKAMRQRTNVDPVKNTVAQFSLKQAFDTLDTSAIGSGDPGWYTLGKNWLAVLDEAHMNGTQHAPITRATLTNLATVLSTGKLKEAKAVGTPKSLAELLKFDPIKNKDLGDTEELKEVRNVVMTAVRALYPGMQENDERIVPLENLGLVLKEMRSQKVMDDEKTVLVPNSDLNTITGTPVIAAKALPNYELDLSDKPEEVDALLRSHELLDYRSVLASLAMPDFSTLNQDRIWAKSLTHYLGTDSPATVTDLEIIGGTSQIGAAPGFDFSVLQATKGKGEETFLYVIRDRLEEKEPRLLVVGPESIPQAFEAEMNRNRITYVSITDTRCSEKVDGFMAEGAKSRQDKGKVKEGLSQTVMLGLMNAFAKVCSINIDGQEDVIPEKSTIGSVITKNRGQNDIFIKMMRPKNLS